jgi:hypothetical protein
VAFYLNTIISLLKLCDKNEEQKNRV